MFVLNSRHYFKVQCMPNRTDTPQVVEVLPCPTRSMGAGECRRPCGALVPYCYTFAIQNEMSYRKQRERSKERTRESARDEERRWRQDTNSRGRDKHSNITSFLYLTTRLRVAAVGCLGEFGVRARCCGAHHTVPVGWPGADVLLLSFPLLLVLLLLLLPSGSLFG